MNFKSFALLLAIGTLGLFIYLKVQLLGDENSVFNQTTRFQLGKHPLARNLFSLHNDGDARGEYLKGTTPIVVEVVQANTVQMSDHAIGEFVSRVERITGRSVQTFNVDTISSGKLTDLDLKRIITSNRRHFNAGEANLFIVYAEDFEGRSLEVGKTLNEYAIVLSHKRLTELTQNYTPALEQYQISTLLHEFGHQLGLVHNENPECVMNKEVESPKSASQFSGNFTASNFCDLEIRQLEEIKNSLQ